MNINRDHIIGVIVGVLLGVTGSFGGLSLTNQVRPAPIVIVPPEPTPLPAATATPSMIRVYVNGAVRQTAVYELPPHSLVQQAIEAAGGFNEEANTAVINLAQPLSDGAQVYVPTQGEEISPLVTLNQTTETSSNRSETINVAGLININTATKAELETLPGIGPSTAQNILDHRDANGPFQTLENIMDVSGIGDGRFNQIKDLITVGE